MHGSRLGYLTAFVAVAERRSFTRAASHLGLSPSSLSNAIRCLEEGFGVRLLNRTTRSVALTDAGDLLLRHLSPVFEDVDRAIEAVSQFRDKPAGTIRLTVHPIAASTLLAPILARFLVEYPEVKLDIAVDVERRDIVREHFDAGIHPREDIDQDMIIASVGGEIRLVTAASPDYLARHGEPSKPEDLLQHRCIKYRWGSRADGGPWKFRGAGSEVVVQVMGALTVNDLTLASRAGVDGIGIVQLPESSIQSFVAEGRLIKILDEWTPSGMEFCLFHSSRRQIPIKLRALVDVLRNESKVAMNCGGDRSTQRAAVARGARRLDASNSRERANVIGFQATSSKSAPCASGATAKRLSIAEHGSAAGHPARCDDDHPIS